MQKCIPNRGLTDQSSIIIVAPLAKNNLKLLANAQPCNVHVAARYRGYVEHCVLYRLCNKKSIRVFSDTFVIVFMQLELSLMGRDGSEASAFN